MQLAYEAHDWLTRYYNYVLLNTTEGQKAKQYLHKRGINDEIINKFRLGYAVKDSNITLKFLEGKGYRNQDLLNRKIINVSERGNYFDPLFERIIFPIQNFDGRYCSFGGRATNEKNIKYMNGSSTRIFQKKDNLYGFVQAKGAIQNEGYAVVFEGYFDVLQSHKYGLDNAVASLGTALTIEQALLLKSITSNVIVVFDDDQAGIEASFRSATILEKVGCNVVIGTVQEGLDPDQWFMKHKDKNKFIDSVVKKGINRKHFYLRNKMNSIDMNNLNERFTLLNEILSHISNDDTTERSNWLSIINQYLKVPIKEINTLIEKVS